jgi:four helix bundle protein
MRKGLPLEVLEVYKVAMDIGDIIWDIVERWEYFPEKTLGVQLVNAADSIALNIREGYGRYHYKENRNFCYYSRCSAKETLTACNKARKRNLLTEDEYSLLNEKLERYFRLMYGYIKSIGNSTNDENEM